MKERIKDMSCVFFFFLVNSAWYLEITICFRLNAIEERKKKIPQTPILESDLIVYRQGNI